MMMQEINKQSGATVFGAGQARPKDERGRELISIKGLLEWAFATECASLDYDEVGAVSGGRRAGVSMEYRIMQMGALGKAPGELVRPDTSVGVSYPHDDAELVATSLRNSVEFTLATRVASYARACDAPKWDLGQQRFEPREWGKRNHLGCFGKTEVAQKVGYMQRGRLRERQELWVPVVVSPTNSQIAAAQRDYLDWWGGLLAVKASLKAVEFDRFTLTDRMPSRAPWKESV